MQTLKPPKIVNFLHERLLKYISKNPLEWKQYVDKGITIEYDKPSNTLTVIKTTFPKQEYEDIMTRTLIRINVNMFSKTIYVKLNTFRGEGDTEWDLDGKHLIINRVTHTPTNIGTLLGGNKIYYENTRY